MAAARCTAQHDAQPAAHYDARYDAQGDAHRPAAQHTAQHDAQHAVDCFRPKQSTAPPPTQLTAAPRPAISSGVRPIATLIGSSNLSERSTRRDVELSLFVISTDEGVRAQLDDEQRRLCAHAREADAPDDGDAQAWGHTRIQRASLLQSLMARVGAVAMRSFF
jgi:phosphatidylserine/phosphatidylglycerophosphate/cardiolipin synthase-like enzyme